MDQEKEVERLEKYIPSFDNGTRKKVNRTATHVVNTRGIHSVVGDGRGSVSTAGRQFASTKHNVNTIGIPISRKKNHEKDEDYRSGKETNKQSAVTVFWNSNLEKDVAVQHHYFENYGQAKKEKEWKERRKNYGNKTPNTKKEYVCQAPSTHALKKTMEKGEQYLSGATPEPLIKKNGLLINKMKMLKISTSVNGHRVVRFEDRGIPQNKAETNPSNARRHNTDYSSTGTIPKNRGNAETPFGNFYNRQDHDVPVERVNSSSIAECSHQTHKNKHQQRNMNQKIFTDSSSKQARKKNNSHHSKIQDKQTVSGSAATNMAKGSKENANDIDTLNQPSSLLGLMDSFQDMSLKSHESQSHEKKLIELISEVSKQQMQQQKLLLELLNSRPTTPAHIPGSDSETHEFLYPKQQAMLPQATSHLMLGQHSSYPPVDPAYGYTNGSVSSPSFSNANSNKFRSYFGDSRMDVNNGSSLSHAIITSETPPNFQSKYVFREQGNVLSCRSPYPHSEHTGVLSINDGKHVPLYWNSSPGPSLNPR